MNLGCGSPAIPFQIGGGVPLARNLFASSNSATLSFLTPDDKHPSIRLTECHEN